MEIWSKIICIHHPQSPLAQVLKSFPVFRVESLHNLYMMINNKNLEFYNGPMNSTDIATQKNNLSQSIRAVILDSSCTMLELQYLRQHLPAAFIAVYDPTASENPFFRLDCFQADINMLAYDENSLLSTLSKAVLPVGSEHGMYKCPYCPVKNMTLEQLWYHCPTFHVNVPNSVSTYLECPICRAKVNHPLQVHIHDKHVPNHLRSEVVMKEGSGITQLYIFSLVICRNSNNGKYLLCHEFGDQGFWCPGGAVDDKEILTHAAIRETQEEAGISIELKGILGIEYNPIGMSSRSNNQIVRMRTIFYAEPTPGLSLIPKCIPDYESVGACWCSYEEINSNKMKLRGDEPKKWTRYLEEGGMVYPLSILQEREG